MGFSAAELFDRKSPHATTSFSSVELCACGFDAKALRAAGVPIDLLPKGEFTLAELHAASYDVAELRLYGASALELSMLGCSLEQLRAAGCVACSCSIESAVIPNVIDRICR